MKKIKTVFLSLSIVSLLSCSTTTKLVYIKSKPFQFQKTIEPSARMIRIHKEDVSLYESYIDKMRAQIRFHNNQIENYLNSFKNENDIKHN